MIRRRIAFVLHYIMKTSYKFCMIVISQNNNATVTSSFDILGHGVGLYIQRGLSLVALIKGMPLFLVSKKEKNVLSSQDHQNCMCQEKII
jgi:hypothetical protein